MNENTKTLGDVTLGQIANFVFSIPNAMGGSLVRFGKFMGVTVLTDVELLDSMDATIERLIVERNSLCNRLVTEKKVSVIRNDWRLIRESRIEETV